MGLKPHISRVQPVEKLPDRPESDLHTKTNKNEANLTVTSLRMKFESNLTGDKNVKLKTQTGGVVNNLKTKFENVTPLKGANIIN